MIVINSKKNQHTEQIHLTSNQWTQQQKTILFADVSPGLNMSHSIMLIGSPSEEEAGTVFPSRAHWFTPVFGGVRVTHLC